MQDLIEALEELSEGQSATQLILGRSPVADVEKWRKLPGPKKKIDGLATELGQFLRKKGHKVSSNKAYQYLSDAVHRW